MSLALYLTDAAARDLDELYAGAYESGGQAGATSFLDQIEVVLAGLGDGKLPAAPLPLLDRLGQVAARQHLSDGLRVVFRRSAERVVVVLIAPVRRSFQSLLARRVLDG